MYTAWEGVDIRGWGVQGYKEMNTVQSLPLNNVICLNLLEITYIAELALGTFS